MQRKFTQLMSATTLAASLLLGTSAHAADEFNHLVRIIVPFAPGGTSDILARIIAPKLSTAIGQTVIVENKPGAAGNLGADAVAKAPKDGHTLLLLDVGSLATSPNLFNNLTYDVEKDLAPVGMIMFAPYVLAVHPSVPTKNIGEFIKYAQSNPGKLAVANSGIGGINHIAALVVAKDKGINWKSIPYKGGSAASRAVVSGESNTIINGATATLPFVTSGQLVGLAVTGKSRLKNAPDLPTFKEVGLPAADYGTFQGMFTTAGSPPATVRRLNEELQKVLAQPDIQQKIAEQGGEVMAGKPDDLKNWLHASIKSFGAEIKAANIKVEQ
ncbi:Bug family tripartite tricarboxylate transporter substrate binding protein [Propionivibrio dicarboxylicus]|uniref:Tripartite-type tricarboxylate transporter, receptor component TctC n=1 Tax=Propionivibrio dicarboxylicus TaxID=83767 RepID=A0A1G8M1D0_9RHOO|nr:tripartite tricarboxylate transporter substrate-binding protein [Propionivibrio dicarboxylicus]SDI61695.1 Tripartite-type tricarboxylate transporter, receptor component TctC [Propionivibrio dicarboxylicus]